MSDKDMLKFSPELDAELLKKVSLIQANLMKARIIDAFSLNDFYRAGVYANAESMYLDMVKMQALGFVQPINQSKFQFLILVSERIRNIDKRIEAAKKLIKGLDLEIAAKKLELDSYINQLKMSQDAKSYLEGKSQLHKV